MSKYTVSIGIPVYNESANIKQLLDALLTQQHENLKLEKIIVYSDGSTDNTNQIVLGFNNPLVELVASPERKGKMHGQNEIIKITESDILVLLDGDVLPADNSFLANLCQPLLNDSKVGLVGAYIIAAKPHSFFEKVLVASHEFKNEMTMKINHGNNVYFCGGGGRAFRKEFYKKITWPPDFKGGEDGFSYFMCLAQGWKFVFARNAKIWVRLPNNIIDHAKRSRRFELGNLVLEDHFGLIVQESFRIPRSILFSSLAKYFLRHPILATSYIISMIDIKFFKKNLDNTKAMWDISESTKRI